MFMSILINKTPFHSEKGELRFPYRSLRDLVFVWPDPPPEKLGKKQLIYLPEHLKKRYHDGVGTILAIGPGYTNNKGKYYPTPSELKPGVRVLFDINVPWGEDIEGQDGRKHYVILCGVADILGVV